MKTGSKRLGYKAGAIAIGVAVTAATATAPVGTGEAEAYSPDFSRIDELWYCAPPWRWWVCSQAMHAGWEAEASASQTGWGNGQVPPDGGYGNAFLHSIWHSYMYFKFSFDWVQAQTFGDLNEEGMPDGSHKDMDYQNNRRGLGAGFVTGVQLGMTSASSYNPYVYMYDYLGADNAVPVALRDLEKWWVVYKQG